MSFEFKLPDLGEGIVEGEVVKWLVSEGDKVKEDQPLLEVMTDKATVEITSPKNGSIAKILVKVGDMVQVEQVMVLIDVDGAAPSSKEVSAKPAAPVVSQPVKAAAAQTPVNTGNIQASPATRKLARDLNVDLAFVPGTGPGGRITHEDVQGFASSQSAAPMQGSSPTAANDEGPVERQPLRGLRKKIAENMTRSIHHAAHFSYVDTIDMTNLVALRNQWKADAEKKGIKLSYLPFILKATAETLKKFPNFNSMLDETAQEIVLKKFYHLGVATATDKGLIVPVVKNVDQKGLVQLAKEITTVTEKARAMKADLEELRGSTFTITSLGALGGLFATPIINYPECAIMGIYQIKPTPVVINGQITIREIMYFSLSLDHRVIDGHEAAGFGNTFKKYLEDPQILFANFN